MPRDIHSVSSEGSLTVLVNILQFISFFFRSFTRKREQAARRATTINNLAKLKMFTAGYNSYGTRDRNDGIILNTASYLTLHLTF